MVIAAFFSQLFSHLFKIFARATIFVANQNNVGEGNGTGFVEGAIIRLEAEDHPFVEGGVVEVAVDYVIIVHHDVVIVLGSWGSGQKEERRKKARRRKRIKKRKMKRKSKVKEVIKDLLSFS